MSYQYTECGLDNVYLGNGYTLHTTDYGEGVSIHNIDGLHGAIGRWIIDTPAPITGAEMRFLRLELDLTQRDLAGILNQGEQAVGRWERDRDTAVINGSSDRLLRILYLQYLDGKNDVRRMIDRLASLDQVNRSNIRLCDTNEGWVSEQETMHA